MLEQIGPGCALLDYDNDGWLDLYFVNGRDRYGRGRKLQNALYRNNRDGTFADVTNQAGVPGTGYGFGVAVGDYDNDGDSDLYVCQYGEKVLYRTTATARFPTSLTGRGSGRASGRTVPCRSAWFDYDRTAISTCA
jgi:hypothetical protein